MAISAMAYQLFTTRASMSPVSIGPSIRRISFTGAICMTTTTSRRHGTRTTIFTPLRLASLRNHRRWYWAKRITINPTTLNSFHFTYGRRAVARSPNSNGISPAALGVQNIFTPPLAKDNLQLAVSNGFSTGGSGFSKWGITSFQEADDVDLTRGKHQIAFGGEIIRTQNNQNDEYNDSGTFHWNGQYSNDPLLDFLAGYMDNFTQTLQQDYSYRQTLVELYAQDTVRLNSHLVMNAGLRWEPTLAAPRLLQSWKCLLVGGICFGQKKHRVPEWSDRSIFLGR